MEVRNFRNGLAAALVHLLKRRRRLLHDSEPPNYHYRMILRHPDGSHVELWLSRDAPKFAQAFSVHNRSLCVCIQRLATVVAGNIGNLRTVQKRAQTNMATEVTSVKVVQHPELKILSCSFFNYHTNFIFLLKKHISVKDGGEPQCISIRRQRLLQS